MATQVRVRVAPSPTGDPHVGLAYVTLFNYVFAKQQQGQLILRIEDTDQSRLRPNSTQDIIDSLKWLGLDWDEGPDIGGSCGPYVQSQRQNIYKDHVLQLVASKHAYYCFCTSERLDVLRRQQREQGQKTGYDGCCRQLSSTEVQQKLSADTRYVIRLRSLDSGQTKFNDVLRGQLTFENKVLDDQILLKSDGFPTYHLASVVDDHLMRISHVIRAEEWISSTPKHVQLYKAFGWEVPEFVHLPLLRNKDRSKISKRKNPVSLKYYRRKGILPQAMVNFLGLMGWSLGDDCEHFSLSTMVDAFKLQDIHLGGPIFDVEKLEWMNQHYLKKMASQHFADYMRSEVFTRDYLAKLHPLLAPRITACEQLVAKGDFFFTGELSYDENLLVPKNKKAEEMYAVFSSLLLQLEELDDWDETSISQILDRHRRMLQLKPKEYFMPLRIALTGRKDSPELIPTIVVIGSEMTRFRLHQACQLLHKIS